MMESKKQDDMAEFEVTEAEFDAMMAESDPVEVTGPPAPILSSGEADEAITRPKAS